jgi:hypothetical protein
VTFTSKAGRLRAISAQILELSAGSQVVEEVHNASKTVTAAGGAIPFSWWDETAEWQTLKAGVYKACMTWPDGSKACTGPGWLYTYSL